MDNRSGRPLKILRLRKLRTSLGLSQRQLAQALGVSQNVLSMWETETVLPRTRDLPRLAAVLSCSIDELFIPDAEVAAAERRWEREGREANAT